MASLDVSRLKVLPSSSAVSAPQVKGGHLKHIDSSNADATT